MFIGTYTTSKKYTCAFILSNTQVTAEEVIGVGLSLHPQAAANG